MKSPNKNKGNDKKIPQQKTANRTVKSTIDIAEKVAAFKARISRFEGNIPDDEFKVLSEEFNLLAMLLTGLVEILDSTNAENKSMYNFLMSRLFGQKADRIKKEIDNATQVINEPEMVAEQEQKKDKKKRERKKTNDKKDYSNLPVIEEYYDELPEGINPEDVEDTGEYLVVTQARITPATMVLVKKHFKKRVHKNLFDENGNKLRVPINTNELIPGSIVSPELISFIATSKYYLALPLYRQEIILANMGFPITRSEMSKYLIRVSSDFLAIIYDRLKYHFQFNKVAYCDETTLRVLNSTDRIKSYVYVLSSKDKYHMALYNFGPSRSQESFDRIIDKFQGYLHSDGYQVYRENDGIICVCCHAHCRRKYVDILKSGIKSELALEVVAIYNEIFEIERGLAALDPADRHKGRQELVKPLIDKLFDLVKRNKDQVAPKTMLGRAIAYTLSLEKELREFLNDPALECTNNFSERLIKSFIIGRKNWLFSNTETGATTSSIFYTLIQTAILNAIDPHKYLEFILTELPKRKSGNVDDLLPWSELIKSNCPLIIKNS